MADPPHYETSEFYQPGLISTVGMQAFVIVLILVVFILLIIGARYTLRRSRGLSPGMRTFLRVLGGLARPAAPVSFRRSRRDKAGSRRKTEDHYRIRPAAAEPERDAGSGADHPPEGPPVAMASTVPERIERSAPRKRLVREVAQLPEEAWPFYGEDEIAAVVAVLSSGKVNQWTGSKVFEFEKAYTRYLRNGRAIALANGSVALELALRAFGIGPGDEVIVTPRSFVASAFCVRLVGATPVFADVDADSGNMTAPSVEAVTTPRTKAIIPVHLGGWPSDMPQIMAFAKSRDILVIEDCAQAHGAEIDGLPVGSFGDAACFSFCQDKIITTAGEGGLVTFRDDAAFEFAWSFKDHGKDRRRAFERPAAPGFRWLHDRVGTNWRMTEVAAAIGLIQMDKVPQWRSRRTRNAETWAEAIDPIRGIRAPRPPQHMTGAYYKFYAYLDVNPADNAALRDRILHEAGAAGIRLFSGSCSEIYREAAFADMEVAPLPVARALGESSLMFEVHPTLDPRRLRDRADAVADIIRNVLGAGSL
ncbi:MAG: DegT/DnrJ/EryC1/StrS aminotransferase family protein [Pseudomonadota bacterium]|nr:DegT/DnrJ/EryC1/StrS aminotransferase family protein [Pseudomonadota bacterium]